MPSMPDSFEALSKIGWLGLLPAVVYGAIWLVCAIHCIRKRRFYPVFGKGYGTKLFWGLTFLFFSPALTALYILFGVFMPSGRTPAWWRTALVALPAIACVVFTISPWLPRSAKPRISERDPETGAIHTPIAAGLSAQAGIQKTRINRSHHMTTSASESHLLTLSSVWIQEAADHPLVHQTARALHERLAEYDPIEKIGWGPPGSTPPTGQQLYDFYVVLSLPGISETRYPGYRSVSGTLRAEMGSSPYCGSYFVSDSFSPPQPICHGKTELHFQSTHTGLETPLARYTRTGKELADDLYEQMQQTFDGFIEKCGAPLNLPADMYGPWRDAPEIRFPEAADITVLLAGYDLLNHNHSIWRIEYGVSPQQFLEFLQQHLESIGWTTSYLDLGEGAEVVLRMKKDEDAFWISRVFATGGEFHATPGLDVAVESQYYAHYIDRFAEEEYRGLLKDMLATPSSLDLLLAFRGHFHRVGLEDAFYNHIQEEAPKRMDTALVLARRYQRREDLEKAREVLRKAEILSWFETGGKTHETELEELREELGLSEMNATAPDYGLLRQLGAVFPEEDTFPLIRETLPGQPVIFCWKDEPVLWGVSIRPAAGHNAWQRTTVQVNPGTSWRSGTFTAPAETGIIYENWEQYSLGAGGTTLIDMQVEHLENSRLRYTFREARAAT